MGHSVLGLSHFPTLITPTVTWQDDTLQGCRIKTCLIKVSVLYYNMTICLFFFSSRCILIWPYSVNLSTPPPSPPMRCAVSLSGLLSNHEWNKLRSSVPRPGFILCVHPPHFGDSWPSGKTVHMFLRVPYKESNICIFRCTWVILKLFIQ